MSRPPDFDALQKKWYKKLEDSGFVDIESPGNPGKPDGNLKSWALKLNNKAFQDLYERNSPYFDLANRFLSDFKFESTRDQIIWEYHANGFSVREIVNLLKTVKIKYNRQGIWLTVQRLEKSMKSMYLIGYSNE